MSDILQRRSASPLERPAWVSWALNQPSRSHFVDANGSRLHFLSWNFEQRDKPTLLFVHGFRGHAHWWDFIAPFFAECYRIIALDLSGMGDSAHRPSYESHILAYDIVALAEQLESPHLIAIGHSYGGSRVLRACAERPELFERLIIIDSYVHFEGQGPQVKPKEIRGDREYRDMQSAIARFRLVPHQDAAMACLVDHVARHSLRATPTGVRWKFDAGLPSRGARETDGAQLLAKVTRPVDYVFGQCSAVVSQTLADRIVKGLPDARGSIAIPDGHHHLMFDQPIALISTLRALLASRGR